MSAALEARDNSIDSKKAAFVKGKAEVEEILANMQTLYRKDPSLFEDAAILAEIRTAKICVGLISRTALEQLESEPRKKAIVAAHKAFLKKHRIGHKGVRLGFTSRAEPQCVECNQSSDGSIDLECNICGWLICVCGACGCGAANKK